MTEPKPRKRPARKTVPAPAPLTESDRLADALFEEYGARLVGDQDFSLFGRIAQGDRDPDGATPSPAVAGPTDEALFKLLRKVVLTLAQTEPQAAAGAVDRFTADVLDQPETDQSGEGVEELATEAGVLRFLAPETLDVFRRSPNERPGAEAAAVTPSAESPLLQMLSVGPDAAAAADADYVTPAQAEPPPKVETADPVDDPLPPEATIAPQATTPADTPDATAARKEDATVSYEDIRKCCLAARGLRRKVVVVVGLATTGKSFFVKRLFNTLKRDYTYATLKGLPDTHAAKIDRTKEVLLYQAERIAKPRSPKNFDIYDMPGDQFVKLVRQGFEVADSDRDTVKLIYATLAFADAIVFIAPALQVLKRDLFLAEGDDLDLTLLGREERLKDMDRFIQSLNPMTRVMALLREKMAGRYRAALKVKGKIDKAAARAAAADGAIDEVLAMNFAALQHEIPKSPRLNLLALLLLSRTDELRARLSGSRDQFDCDPSYQLLYRGREHLDHLAKRFDVFSVDFLTAQDGHRPNEDFDPDKPSYGTRGLFEDWLLPSVRTCRRWRWTRLFEKPSVALWLRRRLDPAFNTIWRRDAGAGG
jgi:hypothetical protein